LRRRFVSSGVLHCRAHIFAALRRKPRFPHNLPALAAKFPIACALSAAPQAAPHGPEPAKNGPAAGAFPLPAASNGFSTLFLNFMPAYATGQKTRFLMSKKPSSPHHIFAEHGVFLYPLYTYLQGKNP
jgi:hypothetical protein